jgi:hypothetical protein
MLDDFARDKTGPQLTMLLAIALLFVSQFFLYLNDQSSGMLLNTSRWDLYTTLLITSFENIGSGWHLHPHAFVIIPLLAFLFMNKSVLADERFQRWGWWAGVALVFAATIPGAYVRNAVGGSMGGIAVLIALVAAIRQRYEAKSESQQSVQAAASHEMLSQVDPQGGGNEPKPIRNTKRRQRGKKT